MSPNDVISFIVTAVWSSLSQLLLKRININEIAMMAMCLAATTAFSLLCLLKKGERYFKILISAVAFLAVIPLVVLSLGGKHVGEGEIRRKQVPKEEIRKAIAIFVSGAFLVGSVQLWCNRNQVLNLIKSLWIKCGRPPSPMSRSDIKKWKRRVWKLLVVWFSSIIVSSLVETKMLNDCTFAGTALLVSCSAMMFYFLAQLRNFEVQGLSYIIVFYCGVCVGGIAFGAYCVFRSLTDDDCKLTRVVFLCYIFFVGLGLINVAYIFSGKVRTLLGYLAAGGK